MPEPHAVEIRVECPYCGWTDSAHVVGDVDLHAVGVTWMLSAHLGQGMLTDCPGLRELGLHGCGVAGDTEWVA